MTARRPAIRMVHGRELEEPRRDEWGRTVSRAGQVMPLFKQMDTEEKSWSQSLVEKQERDMPTLGRNFAILAGMIGRILENDDDPAWLKRDKGNTPCKTTADMLKLVTKWAKQSVYSLAHLRNWLDNELAPLVAQKNSRIWLPLLRRALLSNLERDFPDVVARHVDLWLGNALESLPMTQSVGLLRHLMRAEPQKCAATLLMTVTSVHISGAHKKRALLFLLMEWGRYDEKVLAKVDGQAERMPQHFSRPVLDKLDRFLPLAMKVALSLRRLAACILGVKKPLAKNYWQAHRKLA